VNDISNDWETEPRPITAIFAMLAALRAKILIVKRLTSY